MTKKTPRSEWVRRNSKQRSKQNTTKQNQTKKICGDMEMGSWLPEWQDMTPTSGWGGGRLEDVGDLLTGWKWEWRELKLMKHLAHGLYLFQSSLLTLVNYLTSHFSHSEGFLAPKSLGWGVEIPREVKMSLGLDLLLRRRPLWKAIAWSPWLAWKPVNFWFSNHLLGHWPPLREVLKANLFHLLSKRPEIHCVHKIISILQHFQKKEFHILRDFVNKWSITRSCMAAHN